MISPEVTGKYSQQKRRGAMLGKNALRC